MRVQQQNLHIILKKKKIQLCKKLILMYHHMKKIGLKDFNPINYQKFSPCEFEENIDFIMQARPKKIIMH